MSFTILDIGMFEQLVSLRPNAANGPIPGSPTLVAGDESAGWYGEVPASELIDGPTLATTLNISTGTQINPTGPWLKFAYGGKTLFIARNTFRSGISWDALNAANAVAGNRIVTIKGTQYRIRLMRGADADNATVGGREWEGLLMRVHTSAAAGVKWADYTNAQLSTVSGSGYITWCIEQQPSAPGNKVTRGNSSLNAFYFYRADRTDVGLFAWRPVLEVV